jgi:ADP-ribosylglycohydrolase
MNRKMFRERLQGLFGGSIGPLQERIIMSCLLGTIGDRLGVPMETMTRQAILDKNGGREVTTYVDPTTWRICPSEWGTFTRPGQFSDDTALMFSSMRAIRFNNGQYETLPAAMELVQIVLRSDVQGWGGTIRRQAERIEAYFETRGRGGRSPYAPLGGPNELGYGNGAVLRSAPIIWSSLLGMHTLPSERFPLSDVKRAREVGLAHLNQLPMTTQERLHRQRLCENLQADCQMTHPTQVEVKLFYLAMMHLRVLSSITLAGEMQQLTCRLDPVGRHTQGNRRRCAPRLERRQHVCSSHGVSSKLKEEEAEARRLRICSIEELVAAVGNGGEASESVMLAIWIALRHIDDPRAALIEAINAGGDTDSIAYLVGQLVGMHSTLDQLPEEWITGAIGEELLGHLQTELVPFFEAHKADL